MRNQNLMVFLAVVSLLVIASGCTGDAQKSDTSGTAPAAEVKPTSQTPIATDGKGKVFKGDPRSEVPPPNFKRTAPGQ